MADSMQNDELLPWRCADCGAEAEGLFKPCDCVTQSGFKVPAKGKPMEYCVFVDRPSQPEPEGGLVEAVAKSLRDMWNSKKPTGGIGGQVVGLESYRLQGTGNNFEVLLDAADLIERLASRPSPSGEVEELRTELERCRIGWSEATHQETEAKAQLATLSQLAEAMAISVEVDCLSEPETRIAVHNYRAAFPKPTAEEKENG